MPNSLLQNDDAYATDQDSDLDGTPQKKNDDEDGQSDWSEFRTHAQQSKRLCLPSVSPKKRREDVVAESEPDSFERDSLMQRCGFADCFDDKFDLYFCFALNLISSFLAENMKAISGKFWVGMNLSFDSESLMLTVQLISDVSIFR